MATLSEENYLKAIFHLAADDVVSVSTNAIARKMDTKASSATDMIQKLFEKGLIDYQKYKGVKLTEKGRLAAVSVIRKHRLWEVFLVDKLHFSWDEVHEVAEQLEHIKSEKLVEKLDRLLGYPNFDPHGDPIPNKHGKIPQRITKSLSAVNKGEKCMVLAVSDTSKDFLNYLEDLDISIKTEIVVIDKIAYDKSIKVKIKHEQYSISRKVADNLLVGDKFN